MYYKKIIVIFCIGLVITTSNGCDYKDLNEENSKVMNDINKGEKVESVTTQVMNESTESNEWVDGGGAAGLTEQYIKQPEVLGNDYEVTEDIIKMFLQDNKSEIMQCVEQSALERGMEFKKEDVYVYLKGVSVIHIDKDVWLATSSKEVLILLQDKIVGVLSIDNPSGNLSCECVRLEMDNMYERAMEDKKDLLLIVYNVPKARMLISEDNIIYSDIDISDIHVDKEIDYFSKLYLKYAVIPSDLYEKSVRYVDIVEY